MSNHRILIVDDEVNALQAFRRQLRGKYDLECAASGDEALKKLATQGPFAVVVSDMQMPGMNGLVLLKRVRDANAQTVRIMLTGNADLNLAIQAVNEGQIFRFLAKPTTSDDLIRVLDQAVHQYNLLHAESELLTQTLQGAVRLVTDVLAMVHPNAFGSTRNARRLARSMAEALNVEPIWAVELAAMLAPIGWVAVPDDLLQAYLRGQPLTADQRRTIDHHPRVGHDLICNIPRLKEVAELVLHQFDAPTPQTPMAARIIRLVGEYQRFLTHMTPNAAMEKTKLAAGNGDAPVLEALAKALSGATVVAQVEVADLREGMVLAQPVVTLQGEVLLRAELEVTSLVIERLRNFAASSRGVRTPLTVRTIGSPVCPVNQDAIPIPESLIV